MGVCLCSIEQFLMIDGLMTVVAESWEEKSSSKEIFPSIGSKVDDSGANQYHSLLVESS